MSVISDFFTNVKADIEEYTNDKKAEIDRVKNLVIDHDVSQMTFEEDFIKSDSEKKFSFAFSQLRIVERYEVFNKELLLKKLDKTGFEDVSDLVLLHIAYLKACEDILEKNKDISDDYVICMYLTYGKHKLLKEELSKRKFIENGKQQFQDNYIELRKSKNEFMEILSKSEMAQKIKERIDSYGTEVYKVIFKEDRTDIIGEENAKLAEIIYRKEGYPNLSEFQVGVLISYMNENLKYKFEKTDANVLRMCDFEKGIRLTW